MVYRNIYINTICYGRSVVTIADQLYSKEPWSPEERIKKAQMVFDGVLNAFPALRKLMINAQKCAHDLGYVETILGRRRHIPDMQLPEFEFVAMQGYVNPDVNPLDIATLDAADGIPPRIVKQLEAEFAGYKYYGQVVKRTKELAETEHIKVINNRFKISEASRKCVNCVDTATEILTTRGWAKYNEISTNTEILAYDMTSNNIVKDQIQQVHIYGGDHEVVEFNSPTFSSVSTLEHRWAVLNKNKTPVFKTTENIEKNKWPDYPILRVADNQLSSTNTYTRNELKLLGWILTDGDWTISPYSLHLYQSTAKSKNACIYKQMLSVLDQLQLEYTDYSRDGIYHEIYIHKCKLTETFMTELVNRELTFEFVSSLSQSQASTIMWSMIEGDGTLGLDKQNITYTCNSESKRDVFQYLAFIAGYATNSYIEYPEVHNKYPSSNKVYSSVSNTAPIHITKAYYTVTVLRIKQAQIYPHHKSRTHVDTVWCVTTGTGTWVARRDGKVYITGNSIIQGSAAEQTKLAMLLIDKDPEWNRIGGRVILPVHDELIAEVPIEHWEAGAARLGQLMCDAASFLPFASKCDVTVSYRWYGMEYPCKYPQPKQMVDLTTDEIKWVQYHLYECGYDLPVYKDEDGGKPKGDAGEGVNGIVSPEYTSCIDDYIKHYQITIDQFIDHIHTKVHTGKLPNQL